MPSASMHGLQVSLNSGREGQPAVGIIVAAVSKANLFAVYFTRGDRLVHKGPELHLGKAYLVSRLQALLQGQRVYLPRTGEAKALCRSFWTTRSR